jgi:hypothetical protein
MHTVQQNQIVSFYAITCDHTGAAAQCFFRKRLNDQHVLLPGITMMLTVTLETIELDDLLPIGLPADDVGRKAIVNAVEEGLEKAGMEGAERALRQTAGDDIADDILRQAGICFEAGTPVAAADGSVPIETVSVGDLVWAVDPATGITDYLTVTEVFSHHVGLPLEVVIGDDLIRVTEKHPFWVVGEGWVGAENLEPGGCVQTLARTCQAIVSIQVVTTDTWVYNFTVADAHTYFMGDEQWLVHNMCSATGIDDFLRKALNQSGELVLDTIDTRFGRFDVGGTVHINGSQLHISDAMFFPAGESYRPLGARKVMQLMEDFGRAAR